MGHNFEGIAVARKSVALEEVCQQLIELLKQVKYDIDIEPRKRHNMWPHDVCVLFCDDQQLLTEVKEILRKSQIPVGSIADQMEDESILAVDDVINCPSYEWAVVIVISTINYPDSQNIMSPTLKLAMSRAISDLKIFHVSQGSTPISDECIDKFNKL